MGIISDYCVLAGESEEDPPLFFTPFLNVLMTSGTPERLAWSEYIYLLSLRLCLALHRFFFYIYFKHDFVFNGGSHNINRK